jgi:thioredoxin reductase
MLHDVVVVGGGPAGLSAALILGRARKRVLLLDAGTPRNAAAQEIHNLVTRDGIAPSELRRIARAELATYGVEVRDQRVTRIDGVRGAFEVHTEAGPVSARRVLLCVGVIDELPDTPGYRDLWGTSIFQCPYCHGWELQDRAFGWLSPSIEMIDYGLVLRAWTANVVTFTNGAFAVPPDIAARFRAANVPIEERRIARHHADAVELDDGTRVAVDALFARPPQRQTDLVQHSGVALEDNGFVRVSPQMETSRPGIYAAGDLVAKVQGAHFSVAAGAQAAHALHRELMNELAHTGR